MAKLAEPSEREDSAVPRDAPVTPEERRQAIRLIVRFVAAGLAVIIAGSVALLLTRDDADDFGGEITLVDAIGPLSGRSIAPYLVERERALKEATDVRSAVISLDAYRKEADARKLVEGLNVRALIVAAPGGEPSVVTGGLSTWAEEARQDAASERAELEKLLPTYNPAEDGEFLEDAKAQITRLQRVEQTATPEGDVVFAIVLVAPADELRRLSETTGVRVVDVGVGATVPAMSRVRGIRPEETTTSGDPITRPA